MRPSLHRPYAITMWDFSWLERRWPGAGYEDWDQALSELTDRGYDAVRIDAYPHLVSAAPEKEWELLPAWNQTSWGAQSLIRTSVLPQLLEFLAAARRHGVAVGLSSWYRQDRDDVRMRIKTVEDQARIWIDTLEHVDRAGLLDTILYVDFCNEFPHPVWAPYLYASEQDPMHSRTEAWVANWMNESIRLVRSRFPDLDYTYSFCTEFSTWRDQDIAELDVLETHVWMAHREVSDFNQRTGYGFERFEPTGFDNLVANARRVFAEDQQHYEQAMCDAIDVVAEWSRATGRGVYSTECWAVIDWKDWPGLDWDWVKDLTALGTRHAAATGRWVGIATSNFCGPQFHGMWRDVDWHLELTETIHNSPIDEDVLRHHEARRAREAVDTGPQGTP